MRKYISDHWIKSFMIMIGIGLFGVSAGVLQSCDDDDEIQNKPTLYIITEDIEALSTYGGTIPENSFVIWTGRYQQMPLGLLWMLRQAVRVLP